MLVGSEFNGSGAVPQGADGGPDDLTSPRRADGDSAPTRTTSTPHARRALRRLLPQADRVSYDASELRGAST